MLTRVKLAVNRWCDLSSRHLQHLPFQQEREKEWGVGGGGWGKVGFEGLILWPCTVLMSQTGGEMKGDLPFRKPGLIHSARSQEEKEHSVKGLERWSCKEQGATI